MTVPYGELDPPIVDLVRALNAFDGITTIGSCGGHPDPHGHQAPEGEWWVLFEVDTSLAGKLSLEFLAWAVNTDGHRAGSSVALMPASAPPFLNRPGHTLHFDLNRLPSDRPQDDASALATWLDELREQCYVDADAAEHWGDDDEDEAAASPI